MNISDHPLYTVYIAGLPSAEVDYYDQAALELGINLKLELHGCIINTVFDDGKGIEITDTDLYRQQYVEANKIADQYYSALIGPDWREQLNIIALRMYYDDDEAQSMPF